MEQILREKETQTFYPLSAAEKKRMESLGSDLRNIWTAETTTPKDRKELLRTLISEMIVLVNRDEHVAQCTILWEGGAHSTFTHRLNRTGRHSRCTDEEIVGLVRKLANHYPDEMIARILNRQHLKTGQGNSFTAGRICSLRHHYGISKYTGSSPDTESRFYNVEEAAEELKVSKATLLRWLREGFIQGVQFTPGAPWQIDITEELRAHGSGRLDAVKRGSIRTWLHKTNRAEPNAQW